MIWVARLAAVAAAAIALGQGDTPKMLAPGVISVPGNVFGGSMTPDGREIYFSRSVPRSYRYAIFVSRKAHGRWTTPVLAPFSGYGRDFDPVITPDGRSLVFISDRQVRPGWPKTDYDVWQVDRAKDGRWSAPRHLDAPVNTEKAAGEQGFAHNEWFASMTNAGTLYVASDGYEADGRTNVYELKRGADGRYAPPAKLPAVINEGGWENGEPILAPDGRFLLFSSHARKGGFGGWDIYISRRAPDGSWLEAENLGPAVNTPARDYSPRLEPDGHTLVFTSERNFTTGQAGPLDWRRLVAGLNGPTDGNGKIYEIDLCRLPLRSAPCAPR